MAEKEKAGFPYPLSPGLLQKAPTLLEYPVVISRFARGQTLLRYGQRMAQLSFLLEGRAKVFRVMENGRSVLHALFEGQAAQNPAAMEVLGDLELLMGYHKATTDVVAITEGIMLNIPLEPCREKLLSDAKMLRFLGGELARKLERSSRVGAQNLLYPLPVRLAAYMLFSAQNGLFHENLGQVSELLATSYRHLLRTMKGFCESGAVARCPEGYRIVDRAALLREGESILREAD